MVLRGLRSQAIVKTLRPGIIVMGLYNLRRRFCFIHYNWGGNEFEHCKTSSTYKKRN